MIKTSKHITKFSNLEKLENLSTFLKEYRRFAQIMIDHIWKNGYVWEYNGNSKRFSVSENLLEFPHLMNSSILKDIDETTFLSGRTLKCLMTHVAGMIRAEVEKQRKRIWQFEKFKSEGISKNKLKPLIKKIKQNIPSKPNCENIKAELNSICADFLETNNKFEGFVRLKSITKTKLIIKIPIKFSKHTRKLMNKSGSTMLNSFLISEKFIDIRWKFDDPPKKEKGAVIGADQGFKDVLTLSDKQATPKYCPHGHSLESILRKMSSLKEGSVSFRRAQSHRTNFVNWSINQLNLKSVKQVNLEKIWNIGYKSRSSRILSYWTNTAIRDKVFDYCLEHGVHVKEQSCTYRSQRCSGCGIVRKANRKGKVYNCKHCKLQIDADLNASLNLAIDLPEIPYTLRKSRNNLGNGFYWRKDGFFSFETGTSLQSVPYVKEE